MRVNPVARKLLALSLGSVVGLGMIAPPAWAVTTSVDCASDPAALQPAIDAADDHDVLEVSGTCVGTFTINKSLTLRGHATLDGGGAGTVLYVDAFTTVTVRDLTVTNGAGSQGGGIEVEFFASVHLEGVASVRGNSAQWGGGVYVAGFLELNDSSSVRGNTASIAGGGIWDRSGVVMNDASSVRSNTAPFGGGVAVVQFRGLRLNDAASISGNRAIHGGGISASLDAEIMLNEQASVSGNSATEAGGGIDSAGNVTLNGAASVNGNSAGTKTAGGRGGGIASTGLVNLNDASKVQGNKAIGPGADGGGIYHVCDPFTIGDGVHLNGGRVKSNKPNDIVTLQGDCA